MEASRPIRVRFAPSPTGPLHLGNARAALFNWLFAKHEGGKFLLRIEDTDKERSKKEFEKDILDGLAWLGLKPDEKPVRQSERLEIYAENLEKLLNEKKAYWCFCKPEELEMERQSQLSLGYAPKYGGRCRNISKEEADERIKKGEKGVIRIVMPEKRVSFHDGVKGKIEFDMALVGDVIIAKGLREPLYNFAAAVDDVFMNISHVIRGEDHVSNTPKQIVIQEALGLAGPRFAHLPLILGKGRRKLSKRKLETSLNDYRKEGYLAEAMLNFLVLLGWHPKEDRETINREDMVKEFTLERVQKGGAVFSEEKLGWLNSRYLKQLKPEEIIGKLKPFVPGSWIAKKKMFLKAVETERERMKTFRDFRGLAAFFFELPEYEAKLLIWKETPSEKISDNLKKVRDIVKAGKGDYNNEILALAEREGRGEVLWPLRAALSGQTASPGPLEILDVLGKTESLKRINWAIKKLES
ncbi:glutamate--tRNA ligase [Candidatus Jorgensenbacteria bacterium GWA1_49_17]|uniref:Glutamate--tRNA ligase n=1 Tax=Candidatus Jorgensenbacteria bacterium GWA1_49_17 TaxID=1798467 RepID=A0A1F6BSW0_9BACT|nr:MAG: glutamate--tRNA ligase [Candidatus Jorgensenbacteria bacterium GWA1_49_17]